MPSLGLPGQSCVTARPAATGWSSPHHARRHFYELAQGGAASIATEALRRIADLYRIEDDISCRFADERRAVRQQRSRPLVDALQPRLGEKLR